MEQMGQAFESRLYEMERRNRWGLAFLLLWPVVVALLAIGIVLHEMPAKGHPADHERGATSGRGAEVAPRVNDVRGLLLKDKEGIARGELGFGPNREPYFSLSEGDANQD